MEDVTEEEVQAAYFKIALEKHLTIMMVPNEPDKAYVPEHWREAATYRALQDK